jgi:hypothetical protein
MSTVTQTPASWTFTQGRETFGPFPTREQAQEALYDLEHGKAPAGEQTPTARDRRRETFRLLDEIAGSLYTAPASPLIACLDWIDQEEDRQDTITAAVQLLNACPRDEHFIPSAVAALVYPPMMACCVEIERLLLSCEPEFWKNPTAKLMLPVGILADALTEPDTVAALVEAWVDTPADTSRVTVERHDDAPDPCTDFTCRHLTVEVRHDGEVSFVDATGSYFSIAEARQRALDTLTLLADARVRAAIATGERPAA